MEKYRHNLFISFPGFGAQSPDLSTYRGHGFIGDSFQGRMVLVVFSRPSDGDEKTGVECVVVEMAILGKEALRLPRRDRFNFLARVIVDHARYRNVGRDVWKLTFRSA